MSCALGNQRQRRDGLGCYGSSSFPMQVSAALPVFLATGVERRPACVCACVPSLGSGASPISCPLP